MTPFAHVMIPTARLETERESFRRVVVGNALAAPGSAAAGDWRERAALREAQRAHYIPGDPEAPTVDDWYTFKVYLDAIQHTPAEQPGWVVFRAWALKVLMLDPGHGREAHTVRYDAARFAEWLALGSVGPLPIGEVEAK